MKLRCTGNKTKQMDIWEMERRWLESRWRRSPNAARTRRGVDFGGSRDSRCVYWHIQSLPIPVCCPRMLQDGYHWSCTRKGKDNWTKWLPPKSAPLLVRAAFGVTGFLAIAAPFLSYVHLFCLVPYTPGFHSIITLHVFSTLFPSMSLSVIVMWILSGAILLLCSVFLARLCFYVLSFLNHN